jgi:hypothetical protein
MSYFSCKIAPPRGIAGMKKKKPPKKLVSSTKLTRTTFKEDVGKLLLDVGKLVFAGIVITRILYRQLNVVDESIFQDVLFLAGSAVVAICFSLGLFLGKREIKTEKTSFRRRRRRRR